MKRFFYLALGLGTAVTGGLIYLENPLAGICIAVLAGALLLGALLDRRARQPDHDDDIEGRKALYRGIAVRQGRAMSQREDGEISGAPPGN